MADFSSSHHSLLRKMPAAFTTIDLSFSDVSSFLLHNQTHGQEGAANASAAMVEDGSLESSSAVLDTSPQGSASVDRKRKASTADDSSATLSSAHSKDCKDGKGRRGKREKSSTDQEEAPKGYIHVRARRGQATDIHSLAERVRRERISERMRLLQTLVPGCDKVTGKALILDEIINYVQSLQNQVEFLSMRIASMSPVLYGFGLDSDGLLDQTQKIGGMFQEALAVPSAPVLNQEQSPAPSQAMMDTTSYSLQDQGAISFSQSQDNGSYLMQSVGEQRQELLNQLVFSNMCLFPVGEE